MFRSIFKSLANHLIVATLAAIGWIIFYYYLFGVWPAPTFIYLAILLGLAWRQTAWLLAILFYFTFLLKNRGKTRPKFPWPF